MSPHEEIEAMLPLSVAGLLDPAGERRVMEHVSGCAACAGKLETLAALVNDLRELPVPPPTAELAMRTQAMVALEIAAQTDRRQAGVLAAAAGVLSWPLAMIIAYACRLALGGDLWLWFVCSVATGVVAAPAAVALSRQKTIERSLP